jgi:hypothetical protein
MADVDNWKGRGSEAIPGLWKKQTTTHDDGRDASKGASCRRFASHFTCLDLSLCLG